MTQGTFRRKLLAPHLRRRQPRQLRNFLRTGRYSRAHREAVPLHLNRMEHVRESAVALGARRGEREEGPQILFEVFGGFRRAAGAEGIDVDDGIEPDGWRHPH